jgi:DNA-directed RNA polymerase subunit RPC12/RpoP
MFFWGTKGKTVSGTVVEGIDCPSCESKQFNTFGIIRYFHFYWIPTFIISKLSGIECTHCKKTLIGKEISKELNQQIKKTVFTKKNTLPLYSGLFLIACLALFITYSINQSGKMQHEYIEQPAMNDIYIVDINDIYVGNVSPGYKYGIMRIKNVSSTQVEFEVSNIAYKKASDARKAINDDEYTATAYYAEESIVVDIRKLAALKESGTIYSIQRIE